MTILMAIQLRLPAHLTWKTAPDGTANYEHACLAIDSNVDRQISATLCFQRPSCESRVERAVAGWRLASARLQTSPRSDGPLLQDDRFAI
jgi:hypothetical protein